MHDLLCVPLEPNALIGAPCREMSYVTPMRAVLLLTFLASAQALTCRRYSKSGGADVVSREIGPTTITCAPGLTQCMSYYYDVVFYARTDEDIGTYEAVVSSEHSLGDCFASSDSCDSRKEAESSSQYMGDSWRCTSCSTDNCNNVYSVSSSYDSDAGNSLKVPTVPRKALTQVSCCLH